MFNWVKGLFSKAMAIKAVKQQAYFYMDRLLEEGQNKSKDELDAWFIQKRAELKAWSGE